MFLNILFTSIVGMTLVFLLHWFYFCGFLIFRVSSGLRYKTPRIYVCIYIYILIYFFSKYFHIEQKGFVTVDPILFFYEFSSCWLFFSFLCFFNTLEKSFFLFFFFFVIIIINVFYFSAVQKSPIMRVCNVFFGTFLLLFLNKIFILGFEEYTGGITKKYWINIRRCNVLNIFCFLLFFSYLLQKEYFTKREQDIVYFFYYSLLFLFTDLI